MVAEALSENSGRLKIATTHLHARYALVPAITGFASIYSAVDIELTQMNPEAVMSLVATGECQLGLSTVPDKMPDNVVTFPAYEIERCIITPRHHPLLRVKRPTVVKVTPHQRPAVTLRPGRRP